MQKQTDWGAVFVAYAVGVAAAMQVGRVAPAADALNADLGLDLGTLGLTVSLITLASALLGLAAGHVVVRRGAKRSLVFGAAVLAGAVLVGALAGSVPVLLATRAVEGVGYLAVVVAAPTLIARVVAAKAAPAALALWGTFFTLGLSIAAICGGWSSETFGWRGWYGVNAALLVMTALFAVRALPSDAPAADTRDGDPANRRLPRAAWLLGAAFFGVTLLSLVLLSMLPSYLMEVHGFSAGAAGGTTGAIALASMAGSLAYGSLANRLGQGTVVFAAFVLLICTGTPAFGVALSAAAGLALCAVAVAGAGVLVAHVFASVPRLVGRPERIGPANGLIAQIGSIGAFTGPPLVGYLVSASGWGAISASVVVFSISSVVLMAVAERAYSRASAA